MTITDPAATVIAIPRERHAEAAAVLALAFARDPLMRYVFADGAAGYRRALHALFRFSCAVRFDLDWPLLGVVQDARLIGVAGVTEPEDRPWPASLAATYEQYKALVGPRAAARFERYAELAEAHRPSRPHYSLGVIGVRPDARGRGYGRALLAALHALSEAHPTSTGVYLDTEHPANLSFYEHHGYRVIGREALGDVTIWCLFRPNGAA